MQERAFLVALVVCAAAARADSIGSIQGDSYDLTTFQLPGDANASTPAAPPESSYSLSSGSLRAANAPLPPAGGSWDPGAALSTPRQDFKALVLPGGSLENDVLAVGGCCSSKGSLAGCELFHPSNASWAPAGSLSEARWLFQAVPLSNGSALAIGGLGAGGRGVLSSAELFAPVGGGWEWLAAANMTVPRQDFEAVLLADGRVLAAGGFMASSEIYDPSQDTWSAAGSMAEARSAFQAVRLPGGLVLAIGGRGRSGGPLASCELFDPASGTWKAAAEMNTPRAYFAAVVLQNGRVLVTGGKDASGLNLNSTEIYDPRKDSWARAADMYYRRSEQQAVLLPSGEVLVAGGVGGTMEGDVMILNSTERFDPATGAWTMAQPLTDARYVFQLIVLEDGSVMALGGTGIKGFMSTTEVFGSS